MKKIKGLIVACLIVVFLIIESCCGGQPDRFEVRLKNGRVLEYGMIWFRGDIVECGIQTKAFIKVEDIDTIIDHFPKGRRY